MLQLPKKSFYAAALGTLIEYYDYAVFSIFLPIIAPLFFPSDSPYEALIKGYFVLLIAMLFRPLGGLFFGYIGDLYGRRKALLGSIYGIAIATLILGIVPSHANIGVLAAIIVITAKSVQLFCFGGEYNGAGIYVVEHAHQKNEAFTGSFLTATMLFGGLLAPAIGIIITLPFMPAWSWRLAFILGGIIGIVGIMYRKNLAETPNFAISQASHYKLLTLFKEYPRQLLAGMFIGGFATIPFTTVLTFMNPVLMTKGYISAHSLMIVQTFLTAVAIIAVICSGKLADRKSSASVMKLGAIGLAIFSYPLLRLADTQSFYAIIFAEIMLIIFNEMLLGPSNAYLKNAFPLHYRYRGSSLSFCFGMSILGGLTPIVENYLYQWTGHFSAISLWLIFIGLGTFLSIKFAQAKIK